MKEKNAIKALSALSHKGRLRLMRQLISSGPEGMGAGDLADFADIGATTASAQLLVLSNAGLVSSRRSGRHVIYFAEYANLRDLMEFLIEDCCANRPEICCGLNTKQPV